MKTDEQPMGGVIAWFARNGVAANLIMFTILVGGILMVSTIRKEVFPEFSSDRVSISMLYRGAAPEEVEEAVCVRIEEAIQGVDGIKRLRSTAAEGMGTVVVELLPSADPRKALDDIKARVDAIDTFPAETEKAVIQEVIMRTQVINVAISGSGDERALKTLGERARDEISNIPGITQVELVVARPYEVSIEVEEAALRRHGLTFDEVARAVRRRSLDLPGGSVKTDGGEFLLRVKGQAYRAPEFERIPLRTPRDGARLLLGDVARVVDGFAETDQSARFNNEPAVVVQVFRVGDQNALDVSAKVRAYAAEAGRRMPEGVKLTAYQDYSEYLRSRMDLLVRNAQMGFGLVFCVLAMFLRFRLAFWVSIGIPVSFFGTFWLMPSMDVSINMLSLFAFLLVLGIVVDDAIVVSENIYTKIQEGKDGLTAAIEGCREVAVPVVFSVLTTVAAFAPLALVGGNTGKVLKGIPLIVIPTLLFSLVESMLCLPNHLSHMKKAREEATANPFKRFQRWFSGRLGWFVSHAYTPFLALCLRWRHTTLAAGVAMLLLCGGMVAGGWVKFQFFPPVEGDDLAAFVTMPEGTPKEVTAGVLARLERAAEELRREVDAQNPTEGGTNFRHVLASLGDQPFRMAVSKNGGKVGESFARPNLAEVHIQMVPSEQREVSGTAVLARWRELTGQVPDAVELSFTSSLFSSGNAIDVQLSGPNVEELRLAAEELKGAVAAYPAALDVADSYRAGKQELKLAIKPEAEAAGLSLEDLARQVRQAFYGEEAQRIQRGRDDVRVMVRYPEADRRSLGGLEGMRVRMPDGTEMPFSSVAEVAVGRGFANIIRVDRQRSVNVTADVDAAKGTSNEILESLKTKTIPAMREKYPGIEFNFEGEQREQQETMDGLARGFALALFMIFVLIAVPLKSYLHPFVVMSAIPFGFVGALLGHVALGLHLTVLSMFGLVALAGVAVNDSLVLVDFINRARRQGVDLWTAVNEAGRQRFRPILLTSLTTFAGLSPLIMEKSVQAQFLIPMAVSLGFGVMYCTFSTLVLVPTLYLVAEDVRLLATRLIAKLKGA